MQPLLVGLDGRGHSWPPKDGDRSQLLWSLTLRKKSAEHKAAVRKKYARAYYQKHKRAWKEYAQSHRPQIRAYMKMWREKNRERLQEYMKSYKATHPINRERQRLYWRRQILKRHGITQEQYDTLLARQHGRCAICGRNSGNHKKTTAFQIDHDHKTGRNRGLLCTSCNRGLGWFVDSVANLRAAISYLEHWQSV